MSRERERTPFGQRMLLARTTAKMKQTAVCAELKISQGTLSGLEINGDGSTLTPLFARLYRCNPHWLATGEGDAQFGVEMIDAPSISAGGPEMAIAIELARLPEDLPGGLTKAQLYSSLQRLIADMGRPANSKPQVAIVSTSDVDEALKLLAEAVAEAPGENPARSIRHARAAIIRSQKPRTGEALANRSMPPARPPTPVRQ